LAEHSRLHLWLNTALACIAIVVSAVSAFISWKSYSLNVESFGFSSNFTYDCPLAIGGTSTKNQSISWWVGLCWQMTIANQSGSRASVVDYSSKLSSEGHLPTDVLDQNGPTLAKPIGFDGGEARTIVVRVSVPITDALQKLIDDAIKRPTDKKPETLNDVASIAAEAKLDVLGHPATVSEMDSLAYLVRFPSDYKKSIVTFRLQTGRGSVFETQLIYPTGPIDLVPRRKAQ
jgi:hypothetical protein